MPHRKPLRAGSGEPRSRAAIAPPGTRADARASEAVLEEWTRYVELFALAPVGYVLQDLNGVILQLNDAAGRLLGLRPARAVGRPFVARVARPDRARFLEHIRRVRQLPGLIEDDLDVEGRNGTVVHCRFASRQSPRFGERICWTVLTDITERRRLAQEREEADRARRRVEVEREAAISRSEAKDQFLAHLSHELRTPLTPALMAASMLGENAALPRRARELAATILRNIELEARIIDDLLDITRIHQKKLHLAMAPVDVHRLVDEAVEVCVSDAEAKAVRVEVDRQADRATVNGDAGRLRQAFWNLVKNAVKFTPHGGRVTVGLSNDEHGGLRIAVRDTGVGIDPAVLPLLFQPFEQGGPPPADAPGGSADHGLGLGLAICRGIVEAHHGRLWASSEGLGEGATFEIELPTVDVREADEPAAVPGAPLPVNAHRRLRVLLVEDDADSLELLSTVLATAGHQVATATSVAEARARAGDGWDAVVSDVGLPDGSGLDVARHVRALPDPPSLAVALSGYGSADDVARSREAGFDIHLVKPIEPSRLLHVLGNAQVR